MSNEQKQNDIINLSTGAPGPETMQGCQEIMIKATSEAMKDPKQETNTFKYGPEQGDPIFRQRLAGFLSKEYGDNVQSDSLIVTTGATNGLHLTVTTLFPNDVPIFVEDPTFFLAINILRDDIGKTLIPVPATEDGLDLVHLEELFKEYRIKAGDKKTWKCQFWTMLYTMTVYSNPTGKNFSPDQCRKLVHLARKYDVLVFSDDVYNLFHFGEGAVPPRLLAYDKSDDSTGCVLSNGTFSKIFAGGLRLGWIEGPKPIIDSLVSCYQSICAGSFNHFMSLMMSAALQLDLLSPHLSRIKDIYKERMNLMCNALEKYLPACCSFNRPEGGFFVWVTLPKEMDAKNLQTFARDSHQIVFQDGESTSVSRNYRNCIRLSIGFCDTKQIEPGVQQLSRAIQTYMDP
ncbi:uncharacterized protein [Argopecten irradians]|uniref:uncharacterized protein isoform X4 n=1 Tax=Argopecten irradians TaxID=31199 RepID=UPI00371943F3